MQNESFPSNLSLELAAALGILPAFSNFYPLLFMGALFISLLTLVLILISAFVILLVLMQRTSQSGGMGAALGGGAAESAFGSETTNILTKGTIYGIIAFFLVSLGLFLIYQAQAADRQQDVNAVELISADVAEPAAAVEKTVVSIADAVEAAEAGAAEVEGAAQKVVLPGAIVEVVEKVVAPVANAEGTIGAVVESVEEAVAPVVDVEASAAKSVPASN
ncbi:MAG TPA: preprotein translocase subunit SecG [Opitutae bacterium]|nr:preprotein translocase subunit SecG [Opitutae bacterium]